MPRDGEMWQYLVLEQLQALPGDVRMQAALNRIEVKLRIFAQIVKQLQALLGS